MKNKVLTTYLAVFLLICLVFDGVLLTCFADKPWWNNWMIMAPNLFMVLGAFYCHLMQKNVDASSNKLTWLFVYKGVKMLFTVAAMVLYLVFVKEGGKAFIIITAMAYLVALLVETCVYTHYINNLNKENKA